MKSQIALIAIFLLSVSCGKENECPCEPKSCRDFKTQQDAQIAFECNPECYKDLDGDLDGRACGALPQN